MLPFRGAIFDFDGVIVDSEPIRFNTYKALFLKEFDIELGFDYHNLIGFSEKDNLVYFLESNKLMYDIDILREKRKEILLAEASKGMPAVRSIHQVIHRFRNSDIPMAIASNSSYEYIENVLNHFNLKGYFKIISGDRVTKHKPDAEIYLVAARCLNLNPTECLAFEDSPVGMSAVKKAGMRCVAVLTTLEKSEFNSADYFIGTDDLDDVNSILKLFGINWR